MCDEIDFSILHPEENVNPHNVSTWPNNCGISYIFHYDLITCCILFVGISGKSQILFAIVYLSRYLDLVTTFVSVYNTFMKFVFIGSSLGTLYLMYLKFRATYDHNHDSFRIEFLLLPCFVLGLLINHEFSVMEVS